MTGYQGFSEAARLYAENYDVVQEVRAAYEQDATALILALRERLKELAETEVFSWYSTKINSYWWHGECDRSQAATLWFRLGDPRWLDGNRIVLYVETPKLSPEAAVQLRQLAGSELGFSDPQNNSGYALKLEVHFEGDDPLPKAAERISKALRALAEFNLK